jgi:hypothetical protein
MRKSVKRNKFCCSFSSYFLKKEKLSKKIWAKVYPTPISDKKGNTSLMGKGCKKIGNKTAFNRRSPRNKLKKFLLNIKPP